MKKALAIAAVLMPGKRLVLAVLALRCAKRKHPMWFDGEVVLAEIVAYADDIAAQMGAQRA